MLKFNLRAVFALALCSLCPISAFASSSLTPTVKIQSANNAGMYLYSDKYQTCVNRLNALKTFSNKEYTLNKKKLDARVNDLQVYHDYQGSIKLSNDVDEMYKASIDNVCLHIRLSLEKEMVSKIG